MSSSEHDDEFVAFEHKPDDFGEVPGHNSSSEEYSDEDEDEEIDSSRGSVLYVGHIPYGFFEKQMQEFFAQFGKVMMVKCARSSKTARSKGYGWVKFESPDVAEIASKAMDGYMMHGRKLQVRVLLPTQVHKNLFRNSHRKMLPSRRPQIHKAQVNAPVTEERLGKISLAKTSKEKKRNAKFAAFGIDYEFGAVKAPSDAPVEDQEVVAQPQKSKKQKQKKKKAVK